MIKRVRITLATGQWWAIPWWRDYNNLVAHTHDEIEAVFTLLKDIFDAEWFKKERDSIIIKTKKWLEEHKEKVSQYPTLLKLEEKLYNLSDPVETYTICQSIGFCVDHPLFNLFLAEGLFPLQYLTNLGSNLLTIKETGLLGRDLIKRLKNSNEYLGAHFELEFISHLIRKRYSLKRHPYYGRSRRCDLTVSRGLEILFIELKKLQLSHTNELVLYISNLIFSNIIKDPFIRSASVKLSLELSKDLRINTKCNKVLTKWQIIAKQIKDHIKEKIQHKTWGHYIIPDLAEYDLYPREKNNLGISGSFKGLPLLQEAEINKIFRNAVKEALKQLPFKEPGILIVNTPLPLDLNTVREFALSKFEKNRQRYQYLSAIVFVYISFSERIKYKFSLLENPYTIYNISSSTILKDILLLGDQ